MKELEFLLFTIINNFKTNIMYIITLPNIVGVICVWAIVIVLSMLPIFMTWAVDENTKKDQMLNTEENESKN